MKPIVDAVARLLALVASAALLAALLTVRLTALAVRWYVARRRQRAVTRTADAARYCGPAVPQPPVWQLPARPATPAVPSARQRLRRPVRYCKWL